MPTITSSTIINQQPQKVYEHLKDFELFPKFISGIDAIRIGKMSDDKIISKWRINIEGVILKWEEEDTYDNRKLNISFRLLKGDFVQYDGKWEVINTEIGTKVLLTVNIDWKLPNLREYLIPELEKKTKLALRWMLRSLRKHIGEKNIISFEANQDIKLPIVSELITYKNRQNQKIMGFFDHIRGNPTKNPFIIIPTGYGETKRDALSTAYYLARNRFNVIRYDNTNHVGESDGEMVNTTLLQMKNDLRATIDFAQNNFDIENVGIVASSLSNRVALKAVREDKRINLLVGVVGVVDLQGTLNAVYKEDMVGAFLKGEQWGVTDVLGCEVSFENFLKYAVDYRFHDFNTTIDDINNIDIPVVFLVAENDAWVKMDQVKIIYEKAKSRESEFHLIPEALHQLQENPEAVKTSLRQIVVSCNKHLFRKEIGLKDVIEPSLREIAIQNRIEKERLRYLIKVTKETEKDFWSEYLQKYYVLIKSPDYRQYMTVLGEALDGFNNGDSLLDAGCGNGHFSAWVMKTILKKINDNKKAYFKFNYTGLDLTDGALKEAQAKIMELEDNLLKEYKINKFDSKEYYFKFICHDLDKKIPFIDRTFNKIVCSLLISYINKPVDCIKELSRVLKPKGKIVVTSLKPYNDLSIVYKKFIDEARTEEEIIEGRKFLSSVGRIRQKESFGYYKFYEEKELVALMISAGFKNIKIIQSFGEQINVAIAEKRKGK